MVSQIQVFFFDIFHGPDETAILFAQEGRYLADEIVRFALDVQIGQKWHKYFEPVKELGDLFGKIRQIKVS